MVGIGRNITKFATLRNILYEKGMAIGSKLEGIGKFWNLPPQRYPRHRCKIKVFSLMKLFWCCPNDPIEKCTLRPSHYLQARMTRQDSLYNHDLK